MDPDKDQAWFWSVTQALKNKQHFKSFFKLSFSLVLFFTSIWSLPQHTGAFTLAATAPSNPYLAHPASRAFPSLQVDWRMLTLILPGMPPKPGPPLGPGENCRQGRRMSQAWNSLLAQCCCSWTVTSSSKSPRGSSLKWRFLAWSPENPFTSSTLEGPSGN